MDTPRSSNYIWRVRPLTAEEMSRFLDEHWEVLAAMIDTSPDYPLPEQDVRNSLFHMFVDQSQFRQQVISTAEPPVEVLAATSPRTAAAVAVEILAETRSSMPPGAFDTLVIKHLRDASGYLSGARH